MPHPYLCRPVAIFLLTTLAFAATAQHRAAPPVHWAPEAAAARLLAASPLANRLSAYRAVTADRPTLAAALATAPVEGTRGAVPLTLELPTPDGGTARFAVVETSVMEPGLAAQFPQIKTYVGSGLDDPTATLRADLTPQGFHAQVLSRRAGRTFYLDPVSAAQPTTCLSYWRQDLRAPASGGTACMGVAPDGPGAPTPRPAPSGSGGGTAARPTISLGTSLRTYRLAVAATGEYTQFHGGTVALGQAAIVTMVNRVTGVYEKELAVRMILVANNSALVYTNAGTDPYANTSGDLNANQTTITSTIGSANYDIGHLVGTGGGGVAGLGVVCTSSQKARGLTGSGAPTGDAFWIDYVAHEIGHQFSGNHTFNGSTGSCTGGNRNASTAWEPGSGATIQAYAGICSPQNIQNNSDPYFHGGSIAEMGAFIASTSCPVTLATGNTLPTVSVPANKSIPTATPFQLTATGSDANGDPLTYCWEQMDLGAAGAPINSGTTQTAGTTPPLFRSFLPTASSTRHFPRLSDLRSGTFAVGEYWPTVTRTLTFRCTVRDVHAVAAAGNLPVGGVVQSSNVVLSAVSTAGPFVVTVPNTAVTWAGASTQTVTWNVANTNVAPVSCATVNIRLSTDGGLTFPTLVAGGRPNNGSASVTIPNLPTTQARIMVEAADNYFFDISNVNFTITNSGGPAPTVTSFTPTSGPVGTSVTITGTNLTGLSAVSFNGTAAVTFAGVNATTATATVPAGATTGTISVSTANGTATSSGSFTVTSPTITSFTPTSGPVGTSVTITGANLSGVTGVSFNGTAAVTFAGVNATTVTATVPAGATTGTISVTTGSGTATSATSFTVTLPAPANDLCTAPSLPVLTCGGSVTGTTINSTSTGDPTASCNSVTIQAAAGGVFYRFTGTGSAITMSTCNAGTTYDSKLFVYTGTCGALTCVTANDDAACASNSTASTVTFTSVLGTSYLVFVSGYNANQGPFVLTTTCATPPPTVTSFTPTSGPVGTVVTITGTNLTGLTGVSFNGTAALTFAASNATTATATVPAGATTGTISATTPSGTGTSATNFTVTSPTITSFTPTSGPIGTMVTITGANLNGVTGVSFNGTAAVTFAGVNATTVTATVPAGATTGTISLTTPGGTATSATSFTVTLPAPANDLCTAPSLPVLTCGGSVTGTTVNSTSTGDPTGTCTTAVDAASGGVFYNFVGTGGSVTVSTCGAATTFDTKLFVFSGACGALTCVGGNDDLTCGAQTQVSSVTFTSVLGTTYKIFVSGYQGAKGPFVLSATCATAAPTITSFTPTSGPVGTSVTITGTNLSGVTGVSFNGTAAVTFAGVNATTVTATVPTGATTGTISVTTGSGTATSATSFTVTLPAPANDLCTAPSLPVLTCGGSVTGTTVGSTSTGDPTGTCTTAVDAASGGVFYNFVGTGGSVTVSTCGAATTFDTKLFVFSGACGALTCVGGNDDLACGAQGRVSAVTFTSVLGTTYKIFVSGYQGAKGPFVLSATCANVAPTALALSSTSVAENAAVNTTVGTFSTTDANAGDTFTYALVSGAGSTDNGSFNISGNTLRTSAVFDFETKSSYAIRVRTTDQGSLSFTRTFTISVTDVAEGPGLTSISPAAELPGTMVTLLGTGFTGATGVSFNGTAASSFTVISATQITAVVPAGAGSGPVTVSNAAGPSNAVAFTVYSVYNAQLNQCVSATGFTSTGAGTWQYILAGGQVVIAVNDGGTALGAVNAELIVTTGAPRADAAGNDVLNRSWHLTAANTFVGQTVQVRFYALNTEVAAYIAANDGDPSDAANLGALRIRQYDGPNEDCTLSNNVAPPTADIRTLMPTATQPTNTGYTRLVCGVTDHFSEFYALGDGEVPLPVTLTRLTAARTATGRVLLTWATASEKANAGWIVERTRANARGFTTVSELLEGAGTTTAPHEYRFLDEAAPTEALSYRLRQLDFDGTATYSAAVTVEPAPTVKPVLTLVPNPAHGAVRISGVTPNAPVQLLDAIGRVVRELPAPAADATTLDLTNLPAGVYTVRAGAATARLVVK